MNKITKKILRIWITVSSLILFAIGWITLAHAEKPAPLALQMVDNASQTETTETLELAPVLSLEDFSQTANQPTISQPTANIIMPRLRTRGS